MLEASYKPDGWLGILLGQKIYYKFESDGSGFDSKFKELTRALGNKGKSLSRSVDATSPDVNANSTVKWTISEVGDWLVRENLSEYIGTFQKQDIDGVALMVLASFIKKETNLFAILPGLDKMLGEFPYGSHLRLISALQKVPT